MKEADIMRLIQMDASNDGDRLFRNNVGALIDSRGIPVRFGLCIGSGDLIGWTSIEVTQEMVGSKIAVFSSFEVKTDKGKPKPEQTNFIHVVQAANGISGVVRSAADRKNIIDSYKRAERL